MAATEMTEDARFSLSRRQVRLLLLIVAAGFILWLGRGVLGPFVVAAVLAYAFTPVVSGVQERTRLPRAAIIGIGYLVFLVVVAIVAYLAAEKAGAEWRELTSGQHDIVYGALRRLVGADTVTIAGNAYSVRELADQIRSAIVGMMQTPTDAVHMAEQAVDIGLQVVLCLIVTFYFLLDGRRFGQFCLRFLEQEHRADALRIAHRIHVVLGRWIRGQLFLIALVATVLYLILGKVLNVPFSLAISLLSGFLEIIPLVGPIIAAAIAGTVTFAQRGSDTTIVVLLVYIVVRQIEDQVIMPIVIGRAVHLHPVITIFAVLVGLSAFGILGGLLAVPVAAALNVTLRELYPEETGDRGLEPAAPSPLPRLRLPVLGRTRRVELRRTPIDSPQARREAEEASAEAAEAAGGAVESGTTVDAGAEATEGRPEAERSSDEADTARDD